MSRHLGEAKRNPARRMRHPNLAKLLQLATSRVVMSRISNEATALRCQGPAEWSSIISPRLPPVYMVGADNMDNPDSGDVNSSGADNWYGCDFCAADETLFEIGDVWLCTRCIQYLEDEIAAVEALMEAEEE